MLLSVTVENKALVNNSRTSLAKRRLTAEVFIIYLDILDSFFRKTLADSCTKCTKYNAFDTDLAQ